MTDPRIISINDYTYALPEGKIALHPQAERDASKLLVYRNGHISEDVYRNIGTHLPPQSLLVFNDTKVIKARLRFRKATGSSIEIFCLEPYEAISEYSTVMARKESVRWKCMIGGVSKWKEDVLIKNLDNSITLEARLIEKLSDAYVVAFSWQPANLSFAEVIAAAGDIPLPPYIKRETGEEDSGRYQTVYAAQEGSVAAPTAGLHFTPGIFDSFRAKDIDTAFVTLHVGAGTFKPVKAAVMEAHEMHAEWIDADLETIARIKNALPGNVIAVGTTSLRTLESLYWMGVKVLLDPGIEDIMIRQWDVYDAPLAGTQYDPGEALDALIDWLKKKECSRLFIQTQILIAPGYRFRIAAAIITNFHQPQSTLLLLVAAAIGDDWRKVYGYALEHDFRFLSYGDGSLLYLKSGI